VYFDIKHRRGNELLEKQTKENVKFKKNETDQHLYYFPVAIYKSLTNPDKKEIKIIGFQ